MSLAREWNMMFVNRRRHLSALDISQCPFVVYESRSKCWFTWFAYQHNTSRSKFNAFVVLTQRGWSWCQLISAYCEFSKLELLERGAEFDLVVPLLTSLVKFESWFDIANLLQECASSRFRCSCDLRSLHHLGQVLFADLTAVFQLRCLHSGFEFQVNSSAQWKDEGLVPEARQVVLDLLILQEERCSLKSFLSVSCCCLSHSQL